MRKKRIYWGALVGGGDGEKSYPGVKKLIEAYELLNEGQRKLKSGKCTPKLIKCKRKVNIKLKGGMKGGNLNTPERSKPKFKPQRLTLKHFWRNADLVEKDTGQN